MSSLWIAVVLVILVIAGGFFLLRKPADKEIALAFTRGGAPAAEEDSLAIGSDGFAVLQTGPSGRSKQVTLNLTPAQLAAVRSAVLQADVLGLAERYDSDNRISESPLSILKVSIDGKQKVIYIDETAELPPGLEQLLTRLKTLMYPGS